jgi:deferrochelatase/peroxidase EfeB
MAEHGGARLVLSRRDLLGAAAAGTAGLVVGRLADPFLATLPGAGAPPIPARADAAMAVREERRSIVHPFFGPHQSGVSTPAQDHLQLVAFDMREGSRRRDLVALLRDWSAAAAHLTRGQPVPTLDDAAADPGSPPPDSGEAIGLGANGLTVTIGFGPALFELDGVDRYGIAALGPPELRPLPAVAGDALDPTRSDGDLCIQACADDPLVALHAARNLARIAAGVATIRWWQTGFRESSPGGAPSTPHTPRNLMGFKDGTANIAADDHARLDEHVWLPRATIPAWLSGGTYLVVRRIEMFIEDWDRQPLTAQEAVFGREKAGGAPLTGGDEFTEPDLGARLHGDEAIDAAAHVRRAHPSTNGGVRILRRGYNYVSGVRGAGCLDAGLVFISFQRSPEQFVTLQRALATDLLNDYIRHVGSGLFVVPPGASEGGFVGETLLG